jgi:hypothetical protein
VNAVASALTSTSFYHHYIKLLNAQTPPEIEDNPKFYPFFKDAIAAIDGSHVNATPSARDHARY